jgi:hypothetical protein
MQRASKVNLCWAHPKAPLYAQVAKLKKSRQTTKPLPPKTHCPILPCTKSAQRVAFSFGWTWIIGVTSISKEGARNHGWLNVAGGDFFELKIPIPPTEYLDKIVPIIETMDATKLIMESKISCSLALQKSLINQIF